MSAKWLRDGVRDGNFAEPHAQQLAQKLARWSLRAVRRAEARHGGGENVGHAGAAKRFIARTATSSASAAIKTAGDADDGSCCMRVLDALGKPVRLHRRRIASQRSARAAVVRRDERRGRDGAGELAGARSGSSKIDHPIVAVIRRAERWCARQRSAERCRSRSSSVQA